MTDQTSRGQSIDGVKVLAYLPPKLELPFSKALTFYLENKSYSNLINIRRGERKRGLGEEGLFSPEPS